MVETTKRAVPMQLKTKKPIVNRLANFFMSGLFANFAYPREAKYATPKPVTMLNVAPMFAAIYNFLTIKRPVLNILPTGTGVNELCTPLIYG